MVGLPQLEKGKLLTYPQKGKKDNPDNYRLVNLTLVPHRVMEVGRGLLRSSSPAPCSHRVSYSRLPRIVSSWVLSISQDGDSAISLGNLFQCLTMLTVKKMFLLCSDGFSCFNLCPPPLVLSVGGTEKSLAPSSSSPHPIRYYIH